MLSFIRHHRRPICIGFRWRTDGVSRRRKKKMRSVDFVAFRWLIITHMENELLDDIWRQADSDSFIVGPGPATAALYTPSYIFSSQWKIPSSFNCIWMGMHWEGLMRCLSGRRSLATRTAYWHTAWGWLDLPEMMARAARARLTTEWYSFTSATPLSVAL